MTASMTGFAARTLHLPYASITLDLRSVNQRYLELHFRLADEVRALEPQIRDLISQRLVRGKVECRIGIVPASTATQDNGLNPAILEQLAGWQARIHARLPDCPPLTSGEILRWPGVVSSASASPEEIARHTLDGLNAALEELTQTRLREGAVLRQHILARLAAAETEVSALRPQLPGLIQAQRDKLADRLNAVLGETGHERLAQEIALLAQKLDIDEELARLATHFNEVHRVLDQPGAVGKRLDFLMQELHREANTLGSKSAAAETSRVSLELKVLIEQMREQVQNIE
ncbi:MAG: YicC/YloC family endoribonuclease [Thiobacillus sp.]